MCEREGETETDRQAEVYISIDLVEHLHKYKFCIFSNNHFNVHQFKIFSLHRCNSATQRKTGRCITPIDVALEYPWRIYLCNMQLAGFSR